ncbi:MAG: hypothetical protein ACRCSU_07160 [Paracoccaceae bacterium]
MATTYYVSFTIADDAGYSDRYAKLMDAVTECMHPGKFWDRSTSFVLFSSDLPAAQIAAKCKAAINPSKDLVLVSSPYIKVMLVVGHNTDDDVYTLVDFAKKA